MNVTRFDTFSAFPKTHDDTTISDRRSKSADLQGSIESFKSVVDFPALQNGDSVMGLLL